MGRKVGHPETIDLKGSAPPATPVTPNFKKLSEDTIPTINEENDSLYPLNKKVLEKGVARCDRWGKPTNSKDSNNGTPTVPPQGRLRSTHHSSLALQICILAIKLSQ